MASMGHAAGGAGGPAPVLIPQFIDRLSDLTPPVVDHLFGIDRATPAETPTFVFLVGAPGVGKSSGHAVAKAKGYLPADGNYATINLDTLLESLLPFRAGSAIGHLLKHKHGVEFSSIQSYMAKQENLGVFKKYNTLHDELAAKNKNLIDQLNRVRGEFASLKDAKTENSLISITDAAIQRAITKGVPIVYETTLSYNEKKNSVVKFEDIKTLIERINPGYKIVVFHMVSEPAAIAERVGRRQELVMPFEDAPFYRYVDPSFSGKLAEGTAIAVAKLRESYAGSDRIVFDEYEVIMDPEMLPKPREFNFDEATARITRAYGPAVGSEKALHMEAVLEEFGKLTLKERSSSKSSTHKNRRRSATRSSERRRRNAATHKKSRSK